MIFKIQLETKFTNFFPLLRHLVYSTFCMYCPSHVLVQTNFRRYFCYISLNLAQTHLDHLKVLDELWSKISIWFDIRWRISPIDPHCKKTPAFGIGITSQKAGDFYNGGLWGNSCPIQLKFCFRVRLKPSNDRGEFELDWARCKKSTPKICF